MMSKEKAFRIGCKSDLLSLVSDHMNGEINDNDFCEKVFEIVNFYTGLCEENGIDKEEFERKATDYYNKLCELVFGD